MDISSIALGGLDQAQSSLEHTAGRMADMANPGPDGSSVDTVDLSTAMVDLIAARQNFAANVKVLQTADEMERRTLDMIG